MTIVIGITGKAHSGKDTSADYIVSMLDKYGYKVIKVCLADQLKYICQKVVKYFYNIDLPIEDFYDYLKKEQEQPELPHFNGKPFKIRTLLQMIGTDICRNMLFRSIWCDYIKEKYITPNNYDIIVVSDIRMLNEIKYFETLTVTKFLSIRINRTNGDQIDIVNQSHESETNIDELCVDYDVSNDDTLDELHELLEMIIHNEIICDM